MNRIYQIIWSRAKQCWVVVAETARLASLGSTSSRKALKLLALALLLGMTAEVQALPQGGSVVEGKADITQVNTFTTIQQTSPKVLIDWQSFDVGAHDFVVFKQPDASSIAFNRVVGSAQASQIMGFLSANGQVWLVNPNGVLFGPNATVNVGGLGVSTLNLQSTTGSTFNFAGNGTGSIINQGNIQAKGGGYVALIANQVSNQGKIVTPQGLTALVGGSDVTVTFPLVSPVSFKINASTQNNLAQNTATGSIQANSAGVVIIEAGAENSVFASAVNTKGLIEAKSIGDGNVGTVYLKAGARAGVLNLGGTIDISSPHSGRQYNGNIYIGAGNLKGGHYQIDGKIGLIGIQWLFDDSFMKGILSRGDPLNEFLHVMGKISYVLQLLESSPDYDVLAPSLYNIFYHKYFVDEISVASSISVLYGESYQRIVPTISIPQLVGQYYSDIECDSQDLLLDFYIAGIIGDLSGDTRSLNVLRPPETILRSGENSGNSIANSGIVGQRIQ